MISRFVCVLACVVLAHSLPSKQVSNEDYVNSALLDGNTGVNEKQEIIKELEKEDANSTEKVAEIKPVAAIEHSHKTAAQNSVNTENIAINEDSKKASVIDKKPEKELDVNYLSFTLKDKPDIDTIAIVRNTTIGAEKKFYFKTINRTERGERYKCRVGFTWEDVIFYYRCLLASKGTTGKGLEETAPLFDSSN